MKGGSGIDRENSCPKSVTELGGKRGTWAVIIENTKNNLSEVILFIEIIFFEYDFISLE